MKQLLLPLFLAACLQVDPSSQGLDSLTTGEVLFIAEERVKSTGAHDDKTTYPAHISELKLKERESFGESVELIAGTPLKDKASLKINTIRFSYATDDSMHDCMLTKEKVGEIKLMRMIRFTSSEHCSNTQATAVYGQYLLTNLDGNKLELAVKIEIGKKGLPSKLHVKDLTNGGKEDSIALTWDNSNKIWRGEDYALGYPSTAGEVAKQIKKDNGLSRLTYGESSSQFSADSPKAVLSAKQYEALLPMDNLTNAITLNEYFTKRCISNNSDSFTKNQNYSYLEFSMGDLCSGNTLRVYGLNTHDVVKYLKTCNAACLFTAYEKGLTVLKFEEHAIDVDCKDAEHGVAFYVESEKLYLVDSMGDDKALWYDCKTKKGGRL